MKHVGVREFKNQATAMLGSDETIVIERHGKPVGFFVPVAAVDRRAGRRALNRLSRLLRKVRQDTGLSEDAIATAIGGSRKTG